MLPLVLIHGGGLDRRCWDRLLPCLDGPALAVDLPGRGRHPAPLDRVDFAACAASVRGDVDAAGFDEVVLVGHSLAGCSMPAVVAGLGGRVRHAVFVACTVPEDGSSSLDTLDPEIQEYIRSSGGPESRAPQTPIPRNRRIATRSDRRVRPRRLIPRNRGRIRPGNPIPRNRRSRSAGGGPGSAERSHPPRNLRSDA